MPLVHRILFLLMLLGSMIGPQASHASPGELPDSDPRVTSSADGLIVEWNAPLIQVEVEPNGRSKVNITGFAQTNQPGAPILPFSSVLVALPPDANPSIEILASSERTERLKAPIALADQPAGTQLGPDGQIIGGAFIPASIEISLDLQPVVLEPLGILRGVHLARLTFYPALPAGDDLIVTTHLKVKVDFNTVLKTTAIASPFSDPLVVAVKSAVINPEHLQVTSPTASIMQTSPALQLTNSPLVAIEVSNTGITEVTYQDLQGIGFPASTINPHNLQLSRSGDPIAYQWMGDGDTSFETDEGIRFFADPRFSRWTPFDTYFLFEGDSNGVRMDSRSADPGGLEASVPWVEKLFEQNTIYTPDCFCAPIPAGRDGDRWVWDRLQRPAPFTGTYTFELAGVDQSKDAELTIWMIGFTDVIANPDHKIEIAVNEHYLESRQWDGKNSYLAEFSFTGSWLNDGENTLTIALPDVAGVPVDGVWLDAFSIRHARSMTTFPTASTGFSGESNHRKYTIGLSSKQNDQVFGYDISTSDQPLILMDIDVQGSVPQYAVTVADPIGGQVHQYWLPLILMNIDVQGTVPQYTATTADPTGGQVHQYWLTTSSAIQSADNLRLVAQSRLGQDFVGAEYLIISPAEFIPALADLVELRESNGYSVAVEDVQAIFDAYGEGKPQPSAIRSFLKEAYDNWDIRPIYVLLVGDGTSDPRRYLETSSETLLPPFLADVDPWAGETAADNRYVTVDGEDILPDMLIGRIPANNTSELETMISKIVQYEQQSSPSLWQHRGAFVADDADTGGNYPFLSENLIDKFPSNPFSPKRLYYSPSQVTPEDFRKQVKQMWDAGNGFIMFTGHSSIHQWAHEIFFHISDVPGLGNGQKLPVVLEMTCFTGSFQVPGFSTLDEDLVRQPNGGAVAAWGSSGLGIATGHQWLAEGFLNSVYEDGPGELGFAALSGKLNLATIGAYTDLIDTFTLLGDPATKLERSYTTYMPITQN